jgi:hypothetical protein
MKMLQLLSAAMFLFVSGQVFALGIDVGPVHLHGTKVKVGNTIEVKITVQKITNDDENKDRVRRLSGTRVNSDEKFEIKVPWGDLDDRSQEILKDVKADRTYVMKIQKTDDDWKLEKIRKD